MGKFLNNKGFTLIEMLIAVTIFSIGMLAVLNMFTVSFSASRSVRALNTATRFAQKMMENMLVNPKNTAAGFNSIINATNAEPGASVVSSANPIKVKWPDPINTDLKFDITIETKGKDIMNGVTLTQAEVRVEWMELNTPKMVNVISYLP